MSVGDNINTTGIFFLRPGNSARNQLSQVHRRNYGGDQFELFSSGLDPKVNIPYTNKVMEEVV